MIGVLAGNVSQLLERIADVDGNRLLDTDGRWYGFFKLDAMSYDMMPESAKLDVHRDYTNAMSAIAGSRFKILSLARDFNWATYVERTKNISSQAARNPRWREWNDHVADRIGSRAPFEREVYLSVPLAEPSFGAGFLDDLARTAELTARWFEQRFGGTEEEAGGNAVDADGLSVPEHVRRSGRSGARLAYTPLERQEAIERSDAIARTFARLLAPQDEQPVEEDIARLILRMSTYGLGEPESLGLQGPGNPAGWRPRVLKPVKDSSVRDDAGTTPYEPDFENVRELLGNCTWQLHRDKLVFYWGSGRISYARFLRVKSMPGEGLQFPDHEWGQLPFAANLLLDGDVKEAHRAERERKNDAQRLEEQVRHIQESGAKVPLKLRRAEKTQERIEAQFAANQPDVRMHATIWVFAASPAELDLRTRTVQDYFKDNFSVETVVPGGNQVECFADFLPAGPRALKGYTQHMPPETAAGSMAPGTTQVGDGGPYLGYTRRTRAVVGRAPERPMSDKEQGSMSGTTVWVGEPGAGKSVGCYYSVCIDAMRDVPALLLDSKGDARNIKKIPELSGAVEEYRVEPGSSTRLPIMRIYPMSEPAETTSLLTSFLSTAMTPRGQNTLDMYSAIKSAASDHVQKYVASGGQRKMSKLKDSFLDCARNYEHLASYARYAADEVDRLVDDASLASLALADDAEYGDVLHHTVGEGLVTVILTHGLQLPKYDQHREDMSENERIAEAIQSVVAASAWRMAAIDRMDEYKLFKRLVFEEAWRMLQNSYGRALINSVDRESRMLRLVCDILTQKGGDLGDTLGLATTRFVGRNTDEVDAAMLLRQMNVEPDPALLQFVARQRNGQFIMQDYKKRTAPIQVEVLPDHWLRILDTTPQDRPDEAGGSEVEVAKDVYTKAPA